MNQIIDSTTLPADALKNKIRNVLDGISYAPLPAINKEQARTALVSKAFNILKTVLNETIEFMRAGENTTKHKTSLKYLNKALASLKSTATGSELGQQYAFASHIIDEIADRLASEEHVVIQQELLLSLLDSGVSEHEVYVSPTRLICSAPAIILAKKTGINLHTLAADIWLSSKEQNPKLRGFILNNAGIQ